MNTICNGTEFVGLPDWANSVNQFAQLQELHQQHVLNSILLPNDPNLLVSSSSSGLAGEMASSRGSSAGSADGGDNFSSSAEAFADIMKNNTGFFGESVNSSSLLPVPINCSDPESILQALNLSYPVYEDPMYYTYSYRFVGTFFQGLIFLIGILGNLLVVFVVARNKSMHSPTNCYLVSLAIADCIVLLAAIPQEIVSYYLVGNQWIWGDLGCRILIFSQNLGINVSSLSVAAFTVERYIAICKPFLAQTVCTVNRAKRIIGGVWIFALIYCFPWLFLTSTFPLYYKGYSDVKICEFKLSREQYLGYYFTDIIVFYVIPLLLSVVLYTQIARILYKSQSNKSSTSAACTGSSSGNGNLTTDLSKPNAARVQGKLHQYVENGVESTSRQDSINMGFHKKYIVKIFKERLRFI